MTRCTIQEQATEVELSALGLRDLIRRAMNGEIKRSPLEIDRFRDRASRLEAAARTLNDLVSREGSPL